MDSNMTTENIDQVSLIRLQTHFVLPVIVKAMLDGTEDLDDIAEHAIHEMLDELTPDAALICIALCSMHIASSTHHLIISKALSIEAEHLIEDHAADWMNKKNETHIDIMQLEIIAEDLESIAELLTVTQDALEEDHAAESILCDILSEQAFTHQAMIEGQIKYESLQPDLPDYMTEETNETPKLDNIIHFPITK